MSRSVSILNVENLILVRALVPVKKRMSANWFATSLERYGGNLMGSSPWQDLVAETLRRLVDDGHLQTKLHHLTKRGTERVRAFFGGHLPGPRTKWVTITNAWIPAAALGLATNREAIERMKDAGGFRGTVIQQKERLPIGATPTEGQALDALVWRALGVETDKKLSVLALHELVLRRALEEPRAQTRDQLANLFTARLVGARSVDLSSIRDTLGRRLLTAEGDEPVETGPLQLDAFAAMVDQAARSPTVQRYGENKAFISSVFDELPAEPDLEDFKAKLIDAHRAGKLRLRAANLVDAMDPELVRRSESNFMSAHYHFVEIEP